MPVTKPEFVRAEARNQESQSHRGRMNHLCIVAAALALAAPAARAQRSIDLTGTPDAAIGEPFTMVTGVRELPGNLAIVTDQFEHRVFLANFAARTVRQIGRQGDGPGEYRFPMAPLPAPGNATWIYDATLRRINVIAPDGEFTSALNPPTTGIPGGILAVRGTDRSGQLFFEGNGFDSETGRFIDSITVVRWKPGDTKFDVMGKVWSGGRVIVNGPAGRMSIAREATPFPAVDAWTVLPDGRVAVIEHTPFRIGLLEPGGAIRLGPAISYVTLRVTRAERDAYRARHAAVRTSAAMKNGGGGAAMRAPPVSDAEFPDLMPPFIASAVLTTPEGEIWIGRSHAAADRTWHYDIFDAGSRLIGSATLGANSAVVGFGAGTVYVARTDPADDLVYLERYRPQLRHHLTPVRADRTVPGGAAGVADVDWR